MSNTDLFDDGTGVQARANLRFGLDTQPDDAAKNSKLAQRYGLPPGVIAEFKPDYETRARVDDANAVLDQSPKLRGWLAAAPENAQIAHDDLSNLSLLESGAGMLAKVPRAIASGLPALSGGLWGAAAFPLELVGLDSAGGWARQQQKNAQGLADRVMGTDPNAGFVEKSVLSGFQSAGQNLAMLPLGFANSARLTGEQLMLGVMGLATGGQSYGKGRDAGLSPAQAGAYGIQDATAEIVTEKFLGAAGLLKNIKAGASAGKLFGYEVLKEVPGEVGATLWQNFNEWGNVNPDKSVSEFLDEQPAAVLQTVIATLVGGSTQIGAIKGVEGILNRAARDEQQATQADQHAQALQDLQTTLQAGRLLERSPENLTTFLQSLVDEGVQHLYLDSAKLIESGVDLQALAQALPSVAAQLDQVQTGGDLVVPTGELLVGSVGQQFQQALIDNARTEVGAMSRTEAAVYMQEKGDAINAEIDAVMANHENSVQLSAERDAVQTQLLQGLNDAGRFTPQVNERYATLAANFYAAMAARAGMGVQQFADTYKLGFSGQNSAAGVYDQSLKSQPPKGWEHVTDGAPASAMWNGSNKSQAVFWTDLTGNLASDVGEVAGFSHSINQSTVSHIKNRHGDPKTESDRGGQIAVTSGDIGRIPEIVTGYDGVRSDLQGKHGEGMVAYVKRFEDGVVLYLEATTKKRQNMAGVSMWKYPPKVDVQQVLAQAVVPDHYAQDAVAAFANGITGDEKGNTFNQNDIKNARGQIALGNDVTQQASVISMLSGADLSTFIHEGGHFFLEVHADLAIRIQSRIDAGVQVSESERTIVSDFGQVLNWMGVTGMPELSALNTWAMLAPDGKRSYHEQWARGFEAFAFEGKSPSLELSRVFQTFRAWLVNVYRTMLKSANASDTDIGSALKVELTDEVRAVMGRMLATNDQIAQAEAARNMGPLFKTPEEAGMTLDEYQRYHDAGKQATLDAVDALQAKGLSDMQWLRNARSRKLKEMQKLHDTLRARIERDVKSEVMRQPLYRAWTFLTAKAGDKVVGEEPVGQSKGVNPEVDNLFTAIAKLGGLDAAQVKAQWGYESKNGAAESGVFGTPVVRKTKGYGLDAMAERLTEYGYLLPDENGKADLDKFEELWHDQLSGVDRYSVHRDMAAAYGDAPLDAPDLPDFGFGKLRTEDLRYMYGTQDDALWRKLSALRMTSDETGLHPEVVAGMFGFESGDKLVKALADAQHPKDVIEGLTDQRMLQEHGDLATPAGLERATDAAIHNEARVRFVATELKSLAQAMSVRGLIPGKKHTVDVLVQMAKAHADTVIARLKVRNIRPHQYAAAEARAAKAAEKAQGDLTKQTMHKRNQLINLYATKAAYAAQDDITKALAYFERVQKPGSIPAEHFEQIQALLSKFDLRKGTTLKSLDNAAQFRTWAKAQIDNGLVPPNAELLLGPKQRSQYSAELQRTNTDGELIYPNEEDQALLLAGFIDQIEVRSYKEATVEELRGLVQAIKQIEHIGRRTKKVLTDRKNREFDAVVARMTDHLSRVAIKAGRKASDTRTPNDQKGQSRLSWRGFFFSHIKAANLLHVMDGGAGGPMWEHLMMTANDAANGEVVEVAAAHDAVQALLKPVKNLGNITDQAQYFPTIDRSLNRQARIVMALNLGNDGNRQRLLDGEGWSPAQIEPVLATLNAADWQFVQGMWDYYESFRPRVGAMERLINGVEPNWVEAVPLEVKTSDGVTLQLRGGYAPVVYDSRANGKSASFADQKDAKAMMQAARVASTVSKSFVKARAEEVKGRPLLLSLNAMVGSLQDTIHYLHWQPWIIDANRLIKAMDAPMRQYYGSEVVHQLRQWAGDNAAGSQPTRNAAERKMVELARNVTFAGLAFNVLSAAKQVTGYTQSISVIGAKWMARGVAHSMRNPRQAYLQSVDKSSFMAKRATTRMRDLAEVNATIQDTGIVRKALDQGGYAMMLAMQSAVDVPTWWGGYEKAIDAGQDEGMAVALADQAVIDAQGSGLQKDLASLERATGAFRLLTGFMAFMNTTLNVNYRVLRSDQSVGAKAVDLVLINALPTFMAMMITAALTPGDSGDDDAEKVGKKYLKEQINFMFGQLVGFREIAQIGAAFSGDPGGDYGGAVGMRMAADILKLAKQVGQGDVDASLRKSVVNAAGDMFKLPAAQINRTTNGAEALVAGETQNPGALLTGYQSPR